MSISQEPGWIEPRSTDLLHLELQEHLQSCDQCRIATEGKPKGFGQSSDMCVIYQQLQHYWMTGQMLDSTT